jgi:hypothetical protein
VANRLELTCETKIERFADYPNIAIVSKTAYHADIGGKSNTGIAPPIFSYGTGAQRDTHIATMTANRSVKYGGTFEASPSY